MRFRTRTLSANLKDLNMSQVTKTTYQSALHGLALSIWNELDVSYRLLGSNASFGFGIYLCAFVPRAFPVLGSSGGGLLVLTMLFLAVANVYGFDICNQTVSPEEDALNKPSRPIPAGLITVQGARRRWLLCWIASPVVLVALRAPVAALSIVACQAWTFFCYAWPRPRHWFWKSLYTPGAIFCSLRAINGALVAHSPHSGINIWLDVAFVSWLFATIHIQDFHDVEGDRKAGRRTLPIVLSPIGVVTLRRITAGFLVFAAATFVILGMYLCQDRYDIWMAIFAALQFLGAIATAFTFVQDSTARECERTYKLVYIPTVLFVVGYLSLVDIAM